MTEQEKKNIYEYIDLVYLHFEKMKNEQSINKAIKGKTPIINTMPITFFGDINKYFESGLRVVTAAINPSDGEFPNESDIRFKGAKAIFGKNKLSEEEKDIYIKSLCQYFNSGEYYKEWFGDTNEHQSAFTHILSEFDASFFGDKSNTAIHTDVVTPIATNPVWSKLPINKKHKDKLAHEGYELWKVLFQYIRPDIVFSSGVHATQVFNHADEMKERESFQPYTVTVGGNDYQRGIPTIKFYELTLPEDTVMKMPEKKVIIIHECKCNPKPFQLFGFERLSELAQILKKKYDTYRN